MRGVGRTLTILAVFVSDSTVATGSWERAWPARSARGRHRLCFGRGATSEVFRRASLSLLTVPRTFDTMHRKQFFEVLDGQVQQSARTVYGKVTLLQG